MIPATLKPSVMHKISTPKIYFLFLFVILQGGDLFAQPNTIDSRSFNLLGLSDYFISGTSTGNTYVFKLYSFTNGPDAESNISFTLRPMTKESFIKNFFSSYAKFQNTITSTQQPIPKLAQNISYDPNKVDSTKSAPYKEIEAEAIKLFYLFIARSIVIDELGNEPIAGTICYVDSLLVLRRDVNDHPFRDRINRLWKMYKQDRKIVQALQESGALDQFLELTETKLKDALPTNTLQALVKKDPTIEDTISTNFTFLELNANLKRRIFKKKKETEFLRKGANDLEGQYEVAINELGQDVATINAEKAYLKASKDDATRLKALKDSEVSRKGLMQELNKAYESDGQILKLRGVEIDPITKKNIGNIGVINKMYSEINLNDRVGAKKDSHSAIRTKLLDFNDLIFSLNCQEETGKEWHTQVNAEIKKWKTYFDTALVREKQALEHLVAKEADSIIVDRNIQIFEKIIERLNELHLAEPHLACPFVLKIDSVNLVQDQLLSKIQLQSVKNNIFSSLVSRAEIQTLKYSYTKISVASNVDTLSDNIISLLNTELDSMAARASRAQTNVDRLETLRASKIRQIAELEDRQMFKAFKVDSIVMEINEGFIENILMIGKVKEYADKYGHIKMGKDGKAIPFSRTLKFGNSSPIGFSRKLDFDVIKGKKLYTRGGERTQYQTSLEDVLSIYIQEHEVGRRDYSPANQKVVLKKKAIEQSSLCLGLKKEATYQLFEAKIFSDFVGLDETEPNGLIQTEISKRINLRTSRSPFRPFAVRGLKDEWNFGFLAFFEPALVLSKVERNNKFLTLDNKDRFVNNQYTPIKFASTLDLKRFENFSAGATANLFLIDIPNIKSTFFANWGFRYGRTGIQDSIRTASNGTVQVNQEGINNFGVNTFDHSSEIIWSIYADERYGFSMSWQHHWFYLRDNRFEQVANTTFFEDQLINTTRASRQFNTIRFITTLEQTANNRGRLFFRYTYNWQQGFWRTGFHQAQVGYSFYLLGRKAD